MFLGVLEHYWILLYIIEFNFIFLHIIGSHSFQILNYIFVSHSFQIIGGLLKPELEQYFDGWNFIDIGTVRAEKEAITMNETKKG